jgi:hypothetical protein
MQAFAHFSHHSDLSWCLMCGGTALTHILHLLELRRVLFAAEGSRMCGGDDTSYQLLSLVLK